MKEKPRCCKTCVHWDIDSARDKAGRVRADLVAKCLYPGKPLLPASFKGEIHYSYMLGERGTTCPCWEERK